MRRAPPSRKPRLKAAPLAAAPSPPRRRAPKGSDRSRRATSETRAGDRAGWIIQIGATDDADKANDLLIRARAKNRATLASAKPLTEKVKKGEDVFYRARFAGLDSATAESACRSLKKSGFSCFARATIEIRVSAMSVQQDVLGLIDPRSQSGRAAMVWMKLLHQRTMRADDFLGARALRQAQDFIRFVARHRVAAAASPPPRLALTLVCVTPAGKPAVEISL